MPSPPQSPTKRDINCDVVMHTTGKAREEAQERLAGLADAAIRDFGVLCFWSAPHASSLEPVMRAKLAARLLQKYGGMRGLRAAAEIEAELRAAGETPWR